MSEQNNNKQVCCPYCASTQVAPVDRGFDGGLGCLGLLLFGWVGLLLGLLGGGTQMYCMNCGRRWSPRRKGGCLVGCLFLIVILILIGMLAEYFE